MDNHETNQLLLLFLLGSTVFLGAQVWTLAGPQSRHSHTAVWDPNSAQMIIFGGQETSTNTDLADVWLGVTTAQQSDQFNQLLPTGTAPHGRYGHVATYDPNSNRMTIFGGAIGLPAPCAKHLASRRRQWGKAARSLLGESRPRAPCRRLAYTILASTIRSRTP